MYSVIITSVNKVIAAAEWCKENIRSDQWEMKYIHPFADPPSYEFQFVDAKIANMVTLKWM